MTGVQTCALPICFPVTIFGFKDFVSSSNNFSDVFVCDGYRLCRAAKLLMSLGYGNFTSVIQYDIYALAEAYVASQGSWSLSSFKGSDFGLRFNKFESSSIVNSPNLSLFPLLAYHKICNDHYRMRNGSLLNLGLVI